MKVTRSKARSISDITIDADLDMLSLYQVKGLASPASGEALRKGNKDIRTTEIADNAAIPYSKLALALTIVDADIKGDAAIALSKIVNTLLLPTILTTEGDIVVRGGSNPQRLAKITTGQYLKATGTGYEGGTPPAPKAVDAGTYTGNNSQSVRQITTGFKCSIVILIGSTATYRGGIAIGSRNIILKIDGHLLDMASILFLHASNGFIVSGSASSYFNNSGVAYDYFAISE